MTFLNFAEAKIGGPCQEEEEKGEEEEEEEEEQAATNLKRPPLWYM